MLTVGSLFAGVGGFDEGFRQAGGFETKWVVEIDPDCQRVLRERFPGVAVLSDVCEVGKHNLAPVDIITGGFPCQDISVAGKRAGFGGKRSSLFHEMVRVVDELQPAFLVWENVPGLLSSFSPVEPPPVAVEGGQWEVEEDSDFETVLRELDRIGYCGAVSLLDAQWFGVPQRRRRLFGVFTRSGLGAAGCAEILSLRARRKGHPAPGREEGAGVAPGSLSGPRRPGRKLAATLRSRQHSPGVNALGRGGEDDANLVLGAAPETEAAGQGEEGFANLNPADRNRAVVNVLDGNDGGADDNMAQAGHLVIGTHDIADALRTNRPGEGGIAGDDTHIVASPVMAHSGLHDSGGQQTFVVVPTAEPQAFQCHGSNVGPMGTLRAGNGNESGGVPFVAHALTGVGHDASEDGTGRGTPLVVMPQAFTVHGANSNVQQTHAYADSVARCLDGMGGFAPNQGGTLIAQESSQPQGYIVNAAESCATKGHARESDVARCLDQTGGFAANQGGTVIMQQPYNIVGLAQQGKNHAYEATVSGCLQHKGLSASGNEAGTLIGFTLHGSDDCRKVASESEVACSVRCCAPGKVENSSTTVVAFQERGREGGPKVETQEDLAYSLNAPAGGGRRQGNERGQRHDGAPTDPGGVLPTPGICR
jgi:site-specific DNA-cytosine methylase